MSKINFIAVLILLSSSFRSYSQVPNWRFIKESDGIKVYYREIPNKNINEVKIITYFDSNLSTIVEALRDVDAYPNWVYKAVSSKAIKRFNQNEMIYYNKLDFPWPLSDRDIAIHTKVIQNQLNKEVVSISYAEANAVPKLKNYVRIDEFTSKWVFKPNGSLVQGEYVFRSNPGGNIPAWLVNLSLDEGPVKTIQNFKNILLDKKYTIKNDLAILN
ncbi:MAG: hypothetical protein IPP61_20625 [Cytophagaceae bacterium]|nr:hypothetical protein [Cytophagaceae bacterium]MBL0327528.1 hypothetical protein [Cytophagaceae bacterium]